MRRYLSINLHSNSANKTLSSYCKMRCLMSLLRKYPHVAKAPLCLDFHTYSLLSAPHPHRRKAAFYALNHIDAGSASNRLLGYFTKELNHLQVVRFCSSSNGNTFKPEAPIGIFEKAQSGLLLSSLGGRFGQSFKRLSRHINVYFKKKDVVHLAENASLVVTTPVYHGISPRRRQPAASERNMSACKNTTETLRSEDKREESMSSPRGNNRKLKRRHVQNILKSKEAEMPRVTPGADQPTVETHNIASSWEEGYLLFARHINKYFGAKVDQDQNRREQLPVSKNSTKKSHSTQSTSQTLTEKSQQKQDEASVHETGGLFHSSSNTTNFGENYLQTAGHINQYFIGQSGLEEDIDGNLHTEMDPGSAFSERLKTISFMDCLRHPTSAIPDLLGALTQTRKPKPAVTSTEAMLKKKLVFSRRQAEELTRGLIGTLSQASSPEALTACVEALNEHLIRYPSCKALMWQEKTAVTLLRKRRTYRDNQVLQSALRESLALIGYVNPVKGCGIRVLSIDGGGTRGVVPLQVLKLLEAETGRKIHQMFDYICGVSTGAVLAFMLGLAHYSLEECADMYRRFGSEVFRQNPLVGTVKMGWSHSYYNTETWEAILQEKLGNRVLIKTAGDELSPKVSAVSAVVNWGTTPKAFVFRNYNHKPGSLSRYAGGSLCPMWQAVRASSAAPGYFQEFPLQSDIHQDGGIILNNPCALAVHESRLLWPNQPFQCVLSLGTGRYDNAKRGPATSTSLRAKISSLICSATDTEGVHTLLDDLLAPDVYFRFNPMLSALVSLDESRPQALDQLHRDTQNYLERNRPKLARLCLVLGAERSAASRTKDWMSERAWEMKQRWV